MIAGSVFSAIFGGLIAVFATLSVRMEMTHVALSYPLGGMAAIMAFAVFIYQNKRLSGDDPAPVSQVGATRPRR